MVTSFGIFYVVVPFAGPSTHSSDVVLFALKRDCAMCSRDKPRVSFKKKNVPPAMTKSKIPSGCQFNGLDEYVISYYSPHTRNVPHRRDAIIYGVVREKTKFHNHCEATPIATPGSRIRGEKILGRWSS